MTFFFKKNYMWSDFVELALFAARGNHWNMPWPAPGFIRACGPPGEGGDGYGEWLIGNISPEDKLKERTLVRLSLGVRVAVYLDCKIAKSCA